MRVRWMIPATSVLFLAAGCGKNEQVGRDVDPRAKVFFEQGMTLAAEGRYVEAAEAYRRVVQIDSNYVDALHQLGDAYRKQHDRMKAIEMFRRVVRLEPDYLSAHYMLGFLYSKEALWEEAIAALRKAVEIDPNFAFGYLNLGQIYFRHQRTNEAAAALEQAIRADSELASAYFYLGRVFARLSEHGERVSDAGTDDGSGEGVQESDRARSRYCWPASGACEHTSIEGTACGGQEGVRAL